jgi:predicted alpha-1,6-mannanase (GH76 family)
MDQVWVNRAVSAEAAVTGRHLRRLWALPGTQLGVVAWPPARRDRWFGGWHYWWQAHLLDCLVDAEQRDPQPERRIKIERQIRSHRLRNNGSWVNNYYDDMAWLALALERASRIADVDRDRALNKLNDQLVKAWVPEDGGRTSSSTPRPTGRLGSSSRATAIGCGVPSRWRTGSTRR